MIAAEPTVDDVVSWIEGNLTVEPEGRPFDLDERQRELLASWFGEGAELTPTREPHPGLEAER